MSSTTDNNTPEPNKTTGQYHSVKGTIVETIGNLTGSKPWQDSGREEHVAGEAEYNAALAKGYIDGTVDRIEGKKDAVVGALMSDKTKQTQGILQQEKGEKEQQMNKMT
ncbi:hypothetical protein C8J56DRAFT_1158301 [Mycena floridula]|nr:hypothetical protein C8J56DRAFT_1158301 [Mycena floridula]